MTGHDPAPAATMAPMAVTRHSPAEAEAAGRRAFWRAAVIMSAAIVALVVVFVIFYPSTGKGLTEQQQVQQSLTHAPQIIPNPSDGRKPTQPGDPGGWEQIMLFFVMVAGMSTVAGLAVRASRRAKRRARAA